MGGAVAIGVGILAGGPLVTSVVSASLAFKAVEKVGDFITELMAPDAQSSVATNQNLTLGAPSARVVVGETVISGGIIKYEKVKQGKKEWQHFYVALLPHPCESVAVYQIDGEQYSLMSGDGYYMEARLGDQTGPAQRSLDTMTNVDSTFIGTNATDVYCEFKLDTKIWPNGIQDLKFLVRGQRVYDPRKDDTAGGAGDHRLADASTWEWTDNPALILFWWKKFKGSVVLPSEMFSLDNIAAEANICDELIEVTDAEANVSYEKRYTCNGVFELSSGHEAVEAALLTSCGGKWVESTGGITRLYVAAYRGPAVFTIEEKHLATAPKRSAFTSLSSKFNIVNATYIDKNTFYQDVDMTPVQSQSLIDDRDSGFEYETNTSLLFTQTESMSQRLGVIKLLRNAAGDSATLVLKRCYTDIFSASVVYLNLPNHLLVGTYEVDKTHFDMQTHQYTLTLTETSADMYNQAQTPPDFDATPNFQLDNTYVAPVNTLIYTPTPESSFRQGILTWDHEVADSVVEYVISIEDGGIVVDSGTSIEPYFNIKDLGEGGFTALVYAKNAFGKPSEAIALLFTTSVPTTPVGQVDIQILAGKVIITGPALPNSAATYEWKYYFSDSFENAFNGGLNKVLTVSNTPQDGTLYVWYRIVEGDLADANWVAFAVPNLVGFSAEQVTPEFIGSLILPESIHSIKDTFSGIAADLQEASNQYTESNGNYTQLATSLVTLDSELGLVKIDMQTLTNDMAAFDSEIVLSNFLNAGFGYEDEFGEFVDGAAFVKAMEEYRIENDAGDFVSIYNYFSALETRTGALEGLYQFGISTYNSFTGVEIKNGTNSVSSIRLFMDNLVFASQNGNVAYEYSALYDRHIWYGATIKIGGTEMIVEDLENPFGPDNLAYWRGATTLNMGVPDFDNLTKANANEWRAPNGEWYRKGKATLAAPELKIVASNGEPLLEYDSENDTTKNYGTFYAANIIGGLYGSIDKTVVQPATAVSTVPQVFLTVTVDGQLDDITFDRILKTEPLQVTWTSPNNTDTKTFVVEVLVDSTVAATASRTAEAPSGNNMPVTFAMPALSVDIPGSSTATTVEYQISSVVDTVGTTEITGATDDGVIGVNIYKQDGSLS